MLRLGQHFSKTQGKTGSGLGRCDGSHKTNTPLRSNYVNCCGIIADNLSKAGWSWGCVSAIDREGGQSGLLTHIATESGSLCVLMKSSLRFRNWRAQFVSTY